MRKKLPKDPCIQSLSLWNQISLEDSHYTGYYFMLSYKLFHVLKQSPSCLHVFAVADPEVHAATPCNFIQMPLLGYLPVNCDTVLFLPAQDV